MTPRPSSLDVIGQAIDREHVIEPERALMIDEAITAMGEKQSVVATDRAAS